MRRARNRGAHRHCPFKGRCAAELASGALFDLLDQYKALAHTEVLLVCYELDNANRNVILMEILPGLSAA